MGYPAAPLKDFLLTLKLNERKVIYVISINKGKAMGVVAGHCLATNKIPVLYLQNSVLGNILNSPTSIDTFEDLERVRKKLVFHNL